MNEVKKRKIETDKLESAKAVGKKIGVRTRRLSVVIYTKGFKNVKENK